MSALTPYCGSLCTGELNYSSFFNGMPKIIEEKISTVKKKMKMRKQHIDHKNVDKLRLKA